MIQGREVTSCAGACRGYVDVGNDQLRVHQTDTACSWLVCHSRGEHCANCIHLPRLSGGPAAQFFGGSQPCVPTAWLAECLLLAGDIESNPGPKPTLKTLTHTRTQPPTLTKYTSSLTHPHTTDHLFNCTHLYTSSNIGPLVVSRESGAPADQVEETPGRASLEKLGCRTPPQLHTGGVGRQQQHQLRVFQRGRDGQLLQMRFYQSLW